MELKKSTTAEIWSQRVSQHEASGKSASQWCQENTLCYKSFITWRRRLKNPAASKNQQQPSHFVELLDNASTKTGVELHVGAVSIILTKGFDLTTLIQVLNLLEKIRC